MEKGDKVRISMRLRGREKAHGDVAFKKFDEFLLLVPTEHTLEAPPKRFPQGLSAIMVKKRQAK